MVSRRSSNGGLIGVANTPTLSVASGVWDIPTIERSRQAGIWPLFEVAQPASTVFLCHADGADAATTFTDVGPTAHTITANGNAQVDTAQSVFGGGSLLLDGTGDFLSAPDHADFTIGTNAFTLEAWVRFNALSATHVIMSHFTGVGNQRGWQLSYENSTTSLNLTLSSDGSATTTISETWTPSTNTWYHVRVCRTGGNVYMFVDGTQIGTADANSTNIFNSSASLLIGANNAGANFFNGWIDEVLIVSGAGLSTSNFTPPSAPYADD